MISNFSSIVCAVQYYTLPFNAVHAVYVHYDIDKSGTKEREFPRSFSWWKMHFNEGQNMGQLEKIFFFFNYKPYLDITDILIVFSQIR